MNKQTAIEWLMQQLPTIDKYDPYYQNLFSQAKVMEKEQITQAFVGGADFKEMAKNNNRRAIAYADQYYRNNYRTILYKPEQNESI